jgi:hypothetical protein
VRVAQDLLRDKEAYIMKNELARTITFWVVMAMAGCGGGGGATVDAPAGLVYSEPSVVYTKGVEITPNMPDSSGGQIETHTVSPDLPPGLSLDSQTGVISGTPTSESDSGIYTVTGTNASGTTTGRVDIEVSASGVAPESITYREQSVTYVTGSAIAPNKPVSTGGEITQFAVSPALPAGLLFDTRDGTISGTPGTMSPSTTYTVTGSNGEGSVTTQIVIEVVPPPPVAPATLAYTNPDPVYVAGQVIVPNLPQSSGGDITQFTVSPALPAGLSLNALTGAISGTPLNVQQPTACVVTGSNVAGAASATLSISIVPAGAWFPADVMDTPRWANTATLLGNGQVLVAGGTGQTTGAPTFIASAGLYTSDRVWALTGSMNAARGFASAAPLGNGQALVAGGFGATGFLASAELYDPGTGLWTVTGAMQTARFKAMSVTLQDGRILVEHRTL